MITEPVIILGSPRSGTSTLFHIMRTSEDFWSLPSEGFHIWNKLCHPSLNEWESEEHGPDVGENDKQLIIRIYEEQIMPAWFWRLINHESIWKFNKTKAAKAGRKLQGEAYINFAKSLYYLNPVKSLIKRRLIDKTLNNCLRLDLVNNVFPDAKYIHLKRDGFSSITSIVKGWLNPDRFITFQPPEPVSVTGYEGNSWKFVMPKGWRQYNGRHIVELCTWQWKVCQQKILLFKNAYPDRFIDIKLEDLINNPSIQLNKISEFINVSEGCFDKRIREGIPVVNKSANDGSYNHPFPEYIDYIKDEIRPLMKSLGYE